LIAECLEPLSNFAFNFSLLRYAMASGEDISREIAGVARSVHLAGAYTLHSSTVQPNLSCFYR
jgi:hypothetical protein